jgi:arsenate reductase
MAEAFARAYGSDVMVAASAGLAPAGRVAPDTLKAMKEKGLDLRDHFPKAIRHLVRVQFDLVINMSGELLPERVPGEVRTWDVPDPVALRYDEHCEVRDGIERLVMGLVLELRKAEPQPQLRGQGRSGR